ncbi:MAG: amino acid ABC transporter ATP-binding protein [Gemmataceae bacterium]|nr:amino acid ABC transporter ATP-binding protein [Gemmataceae bacterium]
MKITVRGIKKSFDNRLVLDGIDLDIHEGETVALLGPSGSGKSTLLRCLNGLNSFDEGTVGIDQYSLGSHNSGQFNAASRDLRRLLGMIFQDFNLFPHKTALENVMEAPRQVLKLSLSEARDQALALLKQVGLDSHANHYPAELSGGQKQRVAIARALAMKPRGLLCDEITSALDPEKKHEVLEVLEKLKAEGMTLVMVTHEIGFARRAADRVVFLAEGKIVEEGPPEQLLGNPASERLKKFLANLLG